MRSNKFIISYILGVLFVSTLFVFLGLVIYFYDPLQLFSEKYPNKYTEDTRYSAKRIIDNYNFDNVLLGSSMMTGNKASELKSGNYINLSFPASTWHGRTIILNYLFKKKNNIKNIITTYDGFYEHTLEYNEIGFVYNDNLKDKLMHYYRSLYNIKTLKCFLMLSRSEQCIGKAIKPYIEEKTNYDLKPQYNIEVESIIKKILVKKNFQEYSQKYNNESISYFKYSYKKLESFVKLIENNPNTTFHIVIPPYPTFNIKNEEEYLIDFINHYKMGLDILVKYPNVIIYGFNLENFTDNLRNYEKDLWHYKPWINSIINKAIDEGTNIIAPQNIDEYFEKLIKKVENYDIKAYEEALKLDIRE